MVRLGSKKVELYVVRVVDERVRELCVTEMTRRYGGVTLSPAQGTYAMADGSIAIDDVTILSSYTRDGYVADMQFMSELARAIRESSSEEAVLFTVDGEAFLEVIG